eukprot:4900915-Ditylum_brightwellii.AAC.1
MQASKTELVVTPVGKGTGEVTTSKYGITVQCPVDIDSIKVQLRETQVEIRKLIRESAKKREEFNCKLAKIYALTGRCGKLDMQ